VTAHRLGLLFDVAVWTFCLAAVQWRVEPEVVRQVAARAVGTGGRIDAVAGSYGAGWVVGALFALVLGGLALSLRRCFRGWWPEKGREVGS
jgi:hypothetical protein